MKTSMALERLSRTRDPEAWAAILQLHGERIQRVGRYFSADAQMCDDICQETLLQIRDHAGAFRKPDNGIDAETAAEGWIMKIACFTALRLRRQNAARQRRESAAALPLGAMETSAEDAAAIRETHRCVREELLRLPQDMGSALTMRYLAGLSDTDIARTLSCSQPTLRKRIQRGLERLREKLAQRGVAVTTVALGALLKHSFDAAAVSEILPAAWGALLSSSAKAPSLALGSTPVVAGVNSAWVAVACATILLLGGSVIVVNRWIGTTAPAAVQAVPAPEAVRMEVSPKPVRAAVDTYSATRNKLLQLLERERGNLQAYEQRIAETLAEQKRIDAGYAAITKERTVSKTLTPERKAVLEQKEKQLDAERKDVLARRSVLERDKYTPKTYISQIECALKEELPVALDGVDAWSPKLVPAVDRVFLPISFEFMDVPFNDAFDVIQKRSGLELEVDLYLEKNPMINLRVDTMNVLHVIDWVVRLAGQVGETKYVQANGKLKICADHGAADLRVRTVSLSFKAERFSIDAVSVLKQELLAIPDATRGESITERNWRLVVNGFPATHKRIADLLMAWELRHLQFQTNAIVVLAERAEVARLMPNGKTIESERVQLSEHETMAFLPALEKSAKRIYRKQLSSAQGREVALLSGAQEPRLLVDGASLRVAATCVNQTSDVFYTVRTMDAGRGLNEASQTTLPMTGFMTVLFMPATEEPAKNVLCVLLQSLTVYPATGEYCNETAKPILRKKAGSQDF